MEPQSSNNRPLISTEGQPWRVLFVTARYLPSTGGTEMHAYEMARRLAASGIDVTVLTTAFSRQLPTTEVIEGVRVQRVPAWPANRDYFFAPALWRFITQGGWDLVHCQGYHTLVAPMAMLAALRAGLPYFVSFHSGGHSSRLRNRLRPLQFALLRPLLSRAARLIGVSQFEAAFFRAQLRLPAEQFVVIPNGSSFPAPAGRRFQDRDRSLIISVGRLEPYKGHQRIIAALPAVLAQRPDVRLWIVGSGPYEAELWKKAQACGVADRVQIAAIPPGDRQTMATVFSSAALMVLLSEYEAHSVAVVEALSLGCPVLGADTSNLHELAEAGLMGVVPLESPPEQVAAAVLEQLRQPLLPVRLSPPTWDATADRLLEIYHEVWRQTPSM